jgi:hypothetical protein
MGFNICGIAINSIPNFNDTSSFDKMKLKTKFAKKQLSNLSPKDLTITFKNNCTIVFLDMIFYKNISEDISLTNLENDINHIFPDSKFLIFVINDLIDFTGYSLINKAAKVRTKVVVKGEIFLDYGELTAIENKLFEEIHQFYEERESYKKIEEAFSSMDSLDRKKGYLILRDKLYAQNKLENNYNYRDGTLDNFTIEKMFDKMLGCEIIDLEESECVEFERRKLNFKKDSLKEYIYLAQKELL